MLEEKAPPDPEIERWIKANKQRFIDQYGEEKGLEILYATAWKRYNNENLDEGWSEEDMAIVEAIWDENRPEECEMVIDAFLEGWEWAVNAPLDEFLAEDADEDDEDDLIEDSGEISHAQRKKRSRKMKRQAKKLARARKKKKPLTKDRVTKRASARARNQLKAKAAGGKKKSEMSAAEKKKAEKRVKRMKGKLKRVTRQKAKEVRKDRN